MTFFGHSEGAARSWLEGEETGTRQTANPRVEVGGGDGELVGGATDAGEREGGYSVTPVG